jgi:hypothetical protein
MEKDLRDLILTTFEDSLEAQLRAVRRLRQDPSVESKDSSKQRMSQVDMAYDILRKARSPLHITEILERIHATFGVRVDRESLVSSLTKKVARSKRFMRTAANTFAVRQEER